MCSITSSVLLKGMCKLAFSHLNEFREAINHSDPPSPTSPAHNVRWMPPPPHKTKINYDAGIHNATQSGVIAFIAIRDYLDHLLSWSCRRITAISNPLIWKAWLVERLYCMHGTDDIKMF